MLSPLRPGMGRKAVLEVVTVLVVHRDACRSSDELNPPEELGTPDAAITAPGAPTAKASARLATSTFRIEVSSPLPSWPVRGMSRRSGCRARPAGRRGARTVFLARGRPVAGRSVNGAGCRGLGLGVSALPRAGSRPPARPWAPA